VCLFVYVYKMYVCMCARASVSSANLALKCFCTRKHLFRHDGRTTCIYMTDKIYYICIHVQKTDKISRENFVQIEMDNYVICI